MTALAVESLTKNFGGVAALAGVSLEVTEGERRVLLGPNGAGKTTLFHAISGSVLPTSGRVTLFGRNITHLRPDRRARLGLARTFQITNLFPQLTVLDSVLLAIGGANGLRFQFLRPMSSYHGMYEEAHRLLDQWGLGATASHIVRNLSYGEQRQLELVLALAGKPRLLLLDEPTAGLSPAETARVVQMVQALPRDMTLVMIEHDMDVAFELADRIAVMHQGRVIAEGDEAAIRANAEVTEIYLGAETE
jgi:branched-chain amino acid transport system ATP-binding protein